MAKNRLIINHFEESIQLTWLRGQAAPRSAPPVFLEHPFDENVMAELRWYLEEYLRFPYGLEPEKAKKTEQKFQDWGQQLFELVFPRTTKAWDFFQEATREGLDQCELGISSDDPAILNLPWELLYNSDYQFLAPSLAGMYRSLNEYAVRAEMPNLPQDKLNILLVIARPYGEKDIALRTIARPLLEALKPIQKQVDLKVLRPPSFEQFERELNEHKGFYHIVHFDGHGDFDPTSQGFQHSLGGLGQGVLVFEHPDGSPQIVTAAQIAQSLTDCRVPIFMLNACKSAQEGEGSFSSVATRLVALGAKGVVAMAYSVYAEAAKHFVGRVYEQLVRGNRLSVAVAAGRREILNKKQRPSPKGYLPLQDWLVPVLYQQETYAPFIPSGEVSLDIEIFLTESTTKNLIGFPEEGAHGFVGRDYDILRLERSLRQNPIVLLQGMTGVGKTLLACGFAQWLIETQGRSLCFFQSFEHGASLVNVVNQVGRTVWGDKFSQHSWEQQQTAVSNYLRTQPCLLIWDNFEPVASFPTGNEPLLTEIERESLNHFLKELRTGQSQVLITSRREEPWLNCGYTLQKLQGLSQADAEEFATKILQAAGVDQSILPPEYLELFKLLDGHPLSLRLVLPYLKTQSPAQLIEMLRQRFNSFSDNIEESSLTATLDYSFTHLSERCRQHLPFLALFSRQVDIHCLSSFSTSIHDKDKQAYQTIFGENLQETDWFAVLNEALKAGILERTSDTVYKMHPMLPQYLKQKLLEKNLRLEELERQLINYYGELAHVYEHELSHNPKQAISILQTEEASLLQKLKLAEKHQIWDDVKSILSALENLYFRTGSRAESRALRQHVLNQLNLTLLKSKNNPQKIISLYIYIKGADVQEAIDYSKFEEANTIVNQIFNELESLNLDKQFNNSIKAFFYEKLGIIEFERRDFLKSSSFYQKALKIHQDSENSSGVASIYHELGILEEAQGNLNKATDYYQRSLKINKESGDFYNSGRQYLQLGNVAAEQLEFRVAFSLYNQALEVFQEAQDQDALSNVHHQLGILMQTFAIKVDIGNKQMLLSGAVEFYKTALKLREDMGDFYGAAISYHQMGIVAQLQKDYQNATAYFQKSLTIRENIQAWNLAATDYHHLGAIAKEQKNYDAAFGFFQKSIGINEALNDFISAGYSCHALGLIAAEKGNLNEAITWFQKSYEYINESENLLNLVQVLLDWGATLEDQSKYAEATKKYLQILKISLESNIDFTESFIERLVGKIFKHLGDNLFFLLYREVLGENCSKEWYEVIRAISQQCEY